MLVHGNQFRLMVAVNIMEKAAQPGFGTVPDGGPVQLLVHFHCERLVLPMQDHQPSCPDAVEPPVVRVQERAGLLHAGCDVICVDSAHGHSQNVMEAVADIRKTFPKAEIIAGNVATAEGALALAKAGANAVKVGMGPGSICTTRVVAGIGVPQVTAVADCARALAKTDVRIISDGGVKYSGDMVKAIAAGAHTVMIGSLFAGTDEAPGEIILYQGRSYKLYRGMGSVAAMRAGSKDRYFQSEITTESKLVPEGIEGRVPYRGSLSQSL